MRDIETQMAHILQRKRYFRARRQARRLAAAGAGLLAMLVAAIIAAPSVTGGAQLLPGSVLGATILGPEVGGYVIVALIAFALGIVTALAARRYRQMNQTRAGAEREERQQ